MDGVLAEDWASHLAAIRHSAILLQAPGAYGPPGVVVNERLEVVQFRGRTGPYLEPPAGEPQTHVLGMAREGLRGPLRVALSQARKTSAPLVGPLVLRRTARTRATSSFGLNGLTR